MASSLYTSDNPVFASFCFYAGILAVKTLMMSFLTGKQRMAKGAFASPEDTKMGRGKVKVDEDVERVRRAHLNDLENILPFFTLGLIYISTGPSVAWAKLLFRIFTGARIMHTIVYAVVVIPQPARALAFFGGMVVNFLMAWSIISTYISAM